MSDDGGSISSFPLKEVRRRPNKRRKAPKGKLEVVVTDELVERVEGALFESCQTGKIGDGKIFVLPVDDAVRIRTNERGDTAITNE